MRTRLASGRHNGDLLRPRGMAIALVLALTASILGGVATSVPALADPTTLTVNSTGDSPDLVPGDGSCATGNTVMLGDESVPECTLRAAIEEANGEGDEYDSYTIDFGIPGDAPYVIQPAGPLPNVTVPVDIDGTSQPGYNEETQTPVVELDGSEAGETASGLRLDAGSGTIGSDTVAGLAIDNFGGEYGLQVSSDATIEDNYIGVDPSGHTASNGGWGIWVYVSDGNDIDGNTISNNGADGLMLESSDDNTIENNTIENNGGGEGGGDGVNVQGDGNTIDNNTIDNNVGDGLNLGGSENLVYANTISDNTSEGTAGVRISGNGNYDNVIGTTPDGHDGSPNTIENNNGPGVLIENNGSPYNVGNSILSNVLLGNNGEGPDIVLDGEGVGEPPDGPNHFQSSPYGITVTPGDGSDTIGGSLSGTVDHSFLIQVFASNVPSECDLEGEDLVGTETVNTGDFGARLSRSRRIRRSIRACR